MRHVVQQMCIWSERAVQKRLKSPCCSIVVCNVVASSGFLVVDAIMDTLRHLDEAIIQNRFAMFFPREHADPMQMVQKRGCRMRRPEHVVQQMCILS